jgi:two-component system response regulator HydG
MDVINVLVVDDDIAFCRILDHMIANEQYKVQTRHSVADALEAMNRTPFDIYVMDYKLPDGGGIDVAQRIRSQGSAAPIILISGYDPNVLASRTQQLHISDFLQKPFSREAICQAVKKATAFLPDNLPSVASGSEKFPTKPSVLQTAVRQINSTT